MSRALIRWLVGSEGPLISAESRLAYILQVRRVKIAKPLLAVTTPLGVLVGLHEAWRFHWWLAVLMAGLMIVISAFFVSLIRRIRLETTQTKRVDAATP